jgi:hypothetical protein
MYLKSVFDLQRKMIFVEFWNVKQTQRKVLNAWLKITDRGRKVEYKRVVYGSNVRVLFNS